MKLQRTIPAFALLVLGALVTQPAMAGSRVTNSYSNGKTNIRNGYTETTVNVNEAYTQENLSQSIKVETYGGDTNISIAEFKNGNLTGYAESTNRQVVDPVAIITYAEQRETLTGELEVTNFSSNNFDGYERFNSHTVESDLF